MSANSALHRLRAFVARTLDARRPQDSRLEDAVSRLNVLEARLKAQLARAGTALDGASAPTPDGERSLLRNRLSQHPRLNFGCGYDKRSGYVNVDMDPQCQPDVLISPADFKFFPGNFYERLLAKDVLEHIRRLESLDVLLSFNAWMAHGGVLELQTTSILGVADRIRKYPGFDQEFGMTQCLFGTQAHPGDFHFTGFTERTLTAHLRAAGFEVGSFALVDEWMFKVEAKKVSAWNALSTKEMSDAEFVKQAFRQALNREPDEGEGRGWREALDGGQSRNEVLRLLFGSHERLKMCALA